MGVVQSRAKTRVIILAKFVIASENPRHCFHLKRRTEKKGKKKFPVPALGPANHAHPRTIGKSRFLIPKIPKSPTTPRTQRYRRSLLSDPARTRIEATFIILLSHLPLFPVLENFFQRFSQLARGVNRGARRTERFLRVRRNVGE